MQRLEGKTALITGAARGLGAQIARRFAEAGAHVIVNDLNLAAAQGTARELGGDALACDVSDSAAVAAMFQEAAGLTDRLDIWSITQASSGVEGDNSARERIARMVKPYRRPAAKAGRLGGQFTEYTDEQWHRMIGVHLNGTFFCCREAWAMQTHGGNIINMSSIMGTFGRPGGAACCAAKAGILGLTRALAHELARHSIRVNAIAPGWIHTDMTDPLAPMHPMLKRRRASWPPGEPDDIAGQPCTWPAMRHARHRSVPVPQRWLVHEPVAAARLASHFSGCARR
ncbi:MAG: SDR family oxidoreductase [Pseudomonadales bacterium]